MLPAFDSASRQTANPQVLNRDSQKELGRGRETVLSTSLEDTYYKKSDSEVTPAAEKARGTDGLLKMKTKEMQFLRFLGRMKA